MACDSLGFQFMDARSNFQTLKLTSAQRPPSTFGHVGLEEKVEGGHREEEKVEGGRREEEEGGGGGGGGSCGRDPQDPAADPGVGEGTEPREA